MIRTAFYIAVGFWLARLFFRGCYRIGYALGFALTRIALGLIAGAKMLFGSLHALAVHDEVRAPRDHRERPAEQRPELLEHDVEDFHVVLHRAVVPDEARHRAARMVIHTSRKRR